MKCKFTCHKSCAYANDDDKQHCCEMDGNGYCVVCPSKCYWDMHRNLPYLMKCTTVTETRTSDNLKKRHDSAITGKEKAKELMAKKELDLHKLQVQVYLLIERVRESIERLDAIALKPNPLTEIEYLDLLIESETSEAEPGWKERVSQYRKIRKDAEVLKKVPKMQTKSKSSSWWQVWR